MILQLVWAACGRSAIAVPKKKNVIESLSESALDSVLHFHLTCVFGAWTATGLWLGYRRLTMAGVAMTTPTRMPLRDDLTHHKRVWKILRKYTRRGFRVVLDEYLQAHTCGVDFNCPMTPRTTDDAGCSFVTFPAWDFQSNARPFPVSCWTLNGTGCPSGILACTSPERTLSALAYVGTPQFNYRF
ncbi:hypothetical protein B0H13DRAFT_1598281 [Mycena leptocephala]|nr:hypothetical protein B0H13DRAFT_1598281 [Mycena leptocephala]